MENVDKKEELSNVWINRENNILDYRLQMKLPFIICQ